MATTESNEAASPQSHGRPAPTPRAPAATAAERGRGVAVAQGLVFVATGLWPVFHMRSFEAVTGPKRDKWLVKTVGLLLSCVGAVLLSEARAGRRRPAALLGATTSGVLALVDLVYVSKRRISRVYLLDALLELGFVGGWLATAPSSAGVADLPLSE